MSHSGVKMPKIIYGTAWKKEETANLVEEAITQGFRGVDTACQPKHYNEKLVGEGIRRCLDNNILKKEDLFIQTKFTPLSGHDPNNIPYRPIGSLKEQVIESFEVSKKNLQTYVIDSLVLHSPMHDWDDLIEVWSTFERFVENGEVRQIGISNCYQYDLFISLFEKANIRPSVLQNRFHVQTEYDFKLREFCREQNIIYQSFWTLTANSHILESEELLMLSDKYDKTVPQILYRYLTQINILPLIGTTSKKHMVEDLEIFDYELSDQDCEIINKLGPFN